MRYYLDAIKHYPIDEIQNNLRVLEMLALQEISPHMHFREAAAIIAKAREIAVYPHDVKRYDILLQEWEETILVYGL